VIDEFSDFQRLIEGCIDLDAAQNNEYQINARFDPEFTQWCEEKEQVKQKIDTIFRAVGNPNPLLGSTNHILLCLLSSLGGVHQVQRELGADKRDKDSVELENSKVHEWHIVVPKKVRTVLWDTTLGANTNISILSR
jgi:hypothetical protein